MAQRPVCGLPGGEADKMLIERLKRNKEAVASAGFQRGGDPKYVPVVVHDIRELDGTGAIAPSRIYDLICSLNQYYDEQNVGILLFLDEINIIKNNSAYNDHTGAGETILFQNKKSGKVNIFIPRTANTGGSSLGTVLGYYDPGPDWMVLRPAEVNGSSNTFYHELGHYFSLPHPFRGWDSEAYDPVIHGVQVGTFSPSNQGIRNEFQNGSNCNIAGDLICDTPPDYNHFGNGLNWGCNYTGGAKDPNGDLIDPDETNIMSYFGDCNPTSFTDDQRDIMIADLNFRLATPTARRLVLADPSPGDVGQFSNAIEPINDEVVASNGNIFIDWGDVTGATDYILEVDRFPNFGFQPFRIVVSNSEYNFDGSNLILNNEYYWRVKAVSPWDACSPWSPVQSFKTNSISALNQIEGLESFKIFPNPINLGREINLQSTSRISFSGNLEIINISGQVMQSEADFIIQSGAFNKVIDTKSLTAGVYFLRIVSSEGIVQEKFVVQ